MSSTPPKGEWLTVADLAKQLGISRSAAYRLGRIIPSYSIPGVGLRFLRSDVDAFVEMHRREPVAPRRRRSSTSRPGMPLADRGDVSPGDDRHLAQLLEDAGLKLKEK